MEKAKSSTVISILTGVLFIAHLLIIAEDIQKIIDDPNKENKPAEIVKIAADFSRYFEKLSLLQNGTQKDDLL